MKRMSGKAMCFSERLLAQADQLKNEAEIVPAGRARDRLLERIRQINAAVKVNEWLSSPAQPPPV
jgi:hypothetical protein